MKKTIIITALVVVLTSVGLTVFVRLTTGNGSEVIAFAEARRGNFEISVSNTGELVAENSIDIKGPNVVMNLRFRAAPIKITDLVPEGTIVNKGDFIATLDRSNYNNTLKDEMDILKKNVSDLEMKILDTAVVLSTLRDEIRNQKFVVEEASITLDQSRFEPPAVQRQASLRLDREQRLYLQKQKIYSLRSAQSLSEIRAQKLITDNQNSKVQDLQAVLAGFTITAPEDGMIIYKKDRMGNKIKTGSMLNPWEPVVATLPDLSSMLSKIYVSEIDVAKVKKGQPVLITVDAFQGKSYSGKVFQIANIGEQLANSDSKVFEVLVKIDGSDSGLRPAMTTSNKVTTSLFENVVYIPEESLHAGTDSVPYVFTKEGKRQVVIPGVANEKNIIIEQGLAEGDRLWLSTPDNVSEFTLAGTELIHVIKERDKAKRLEMKTKREDKVLLTQSDKKTLPVESVRGGTSVSTVSSGIN
jgi:multidrug efflux pump subunit AcrA (membrane-fusion protein)